MPGHRRLPRERPRLLRASPRPGGGSVAAWRGLLPRRRWLPWRRLPSQRALEMNTQTAGQWQVCAFRACVETGWVRRCCGSRRDRARRPLQDSSGAVSSCDLAAQCRGGDDSDEDVDSALLTSEEEDDEDYLEDEGGGRRGRRGRQAAVEASRQSSRLARRRTAGRAGSRAAAETSRPGTRRGNAALPTSAAEPEGQREERQRADREARAARRRAAQQERLAQERHRRQRVAAARRQRAAADTSDEEVEISEVGCKPQRMPVSHAGHGTEAALRGLLCRQLARMLSQLRLQPANLCMCVQLSEDAAGPSGRAVAAQPRASRRRGRAEMEADEGPGPSQPAAEAAGEGGRQRKRQRHGGWRELVNYSWLLVSEQTPGVYVPQVGLQLGCCAWRGLCACASAWRAFCSVPSCMEGPRSVPSRRASAVRQPAMPRPAPPAPG